jgi:PAS domain S-box-containing protein
VDAGVDSQAGYTLLADKPVIVEDLRTETRFCAPPLLHDHGVVSGMSVIIRSADRPFGILGAHTTQRRSFTRQDINFFESIANILAGAIKRAQAEEVSSWLAAIVESTEDAIIGRDTDGVVTSWNKGAEKIFGYTAGEMLGRSFFILIPPSESERVRRNDEKIKRGESISHYETVRVARGGKLVDVSITVSPVRDASGKIIGASTIARDIRERRRLEREILEISSKERQRLGQDLHDGLGQQLTGIALMSKALEERLKGKSSAEVERVTRIIGHVNDAINLTRAMAKGLVPVEVEGQGLISALSELAATSEKLFGITCVSRCDRSVVVHDKLVATHLYRIVQEAIDNSVKHGNAQHVSIQLNRFDGRGALSVTDDGSGFFLDDNRTHGIGLRTMGYRAETIGGSFEIGRGQDGGTVVTCTFPLRESIRS